MASIESTRERVTYAVDEPNAEEASQLLNLIDLAKLDEVYAAAHACTMKKPERVDGQSWTKRDGSKGVLEKIRSLAKQPTAK